MTGPDQAWEVPHQLPSDVYGFTGRTAELAQLDALLAGTQGTAAVVITLVTGTAGVGKTALAVRWAHSVGDRFPDGQLYVDLRGFDPDQPMSPADALAAALRALGVDGPDLPAETAERSARYRTMLAGRRVLIVLDNAYAVDQIRPLLPGGGSCFVVVTSRDSLTGLVVRHGARRLDLDLLPVADGVNLLRRLVGGRVDADPGAAAALVRCCARLPLALRIAAEFAGSRPSTPLAGHVAELADERGPLDRLDLGADERTAVRAVFSWSYRRLPPVAARLFGLLGTCPAPDVDGYAVAALLGTDLEAARQPLDTLIRAHLVREGAPGRYRMHDLLRAYAAECADAGAAPDRRAALTRLVHYYLSTVADAMGTLYPAEQHRRPRVPAFTGPAPPVTTEGRAREWLEAEQANLVAVTGFAAAGGWPTQAGYLAQTLWRHLDTGAHYDDALAVNEHGLRAAREHDDRYGEAVAQQGVGIACYRLGRYEEAVGHLQEALVAFRKAGFPMREAEALHDLGLDGMAGILHAPGEPDRARAHWQEALDRYVALNLPPGDEGRARLAAPNHAF
jgi:tetratricopeptide (TPR) repeat protein